MSLGLHAYALKLRVGNPTAKLILVGIAEHASDDGTAAFASRATLATYGECSIRSVQRHLNYLRRHGFIRTGDQRYVDHLRPDRRPVVYDMSITDDMRKAWAVVAVSEESSVSPRSQRGDILSPRTGAAKPQVERRDKLSPRERGDTGVASGVTQLCPTNPPMNPPPPLSPPPTADVDEPTAGAAAESDSSADDFIASLPGQLTHRQRARLTTLVSGRLATGWTPETLRTELTTDINDARSPVAVYEYRLRQLLTVPPRTSNLSADTKSTGDTHAFVAVSDDDWCGHCHRPAQNAVHRTQGTEIPSSHPDGANNGSRGTETVLAA